MTANGDNNARLGAGPSMDRMGYDLMLALAQPGCPVCRLTRQLVGSYLDGISYELVNDVATREKLSKSLGYCAAHGQELLALKDSLGTAIIYNHIFTEVQRILAKRAPGNLTSDALGDKPAAVSGGLLGRLQGWLGNEGSSLGREVGRALADALEPAGPCPACEYSLTTEVLLLDSCVKALANSDFIDAYTRNAGGLCLPHLRGALRRINDVGTVRTLVERQNAFLSSTCAALVEVINKHDYRQADVQRGSEFGAVAASIGHAGGLLPTHLNLPPARGE